MMRPYTLEERNRTNRKNNSPYAARRKRNLDKMRGSVGEFTVREWSIRLGVSENTVRDYAKDLGATCKPMPAPSQAGKNGKADSSMMAQWATRPIR